MKLNVLVGEVMVKELKTITSDYDIQEAAKIMKKERVGSLIVMSRENISGILTAQDIVHKHVAEGKGRQVKDIMTREVITIDPKKTIEEAARVMANNKIEKLPVVEHNRLIGIITNNDILKIEPALFEILLERFKFKGPGSNINEELNLLGCEICGNYSDDIEEKNGVYACQGCRD